MGIIDYRNNERLQWLRYVLNLSGAMPTVSDWHGLLTFAEEQALTGICMPSQRPENLSQELLLKWIGTCQLIESQNKLLNERIGQLFQIMKETGFRCCLLKGQGNAEMYPNPLMRCSGDIDLWVDADEEIVYQFVKKKFPQEKASFKHIHFPIFDDAKVDVHVTPLKLYSNAHQKRLQQWVAAHREEQFKHKIRLTGIEREVSVPTVTFNAVYQLGHMLIHLIDEGVGLRQMVDYYYVMKKLEASREMCGELISTIRDLGMMRFARAVMWIECEVLGLPKALCVVEPDERRGKRLLNDILEGGNFGRYSQRYHGRKGFYYRGMVEAWRITRLMDMAPREVMARMVSKARTAMRHVFKCIWKG